MHMIVKILTAFILIQTTLIADAAELRGNLTGIPYASVTVTCPDISARSSQIGKSGDYRVTRLSGNLQCSFIVKKGDAISSPISFSTRDGVTTYNGTLRKLQTRILILRK
jgi:hypothetical protein